MFGGQLNIMPMHRMKAGQHPNFRLSGITEMNIILGAFSTVTADL
jgi:hypothetical protein